MSATQSALGPTSAPAPQPGGVIDDPRQRRAILIAVCIALMAVIASVTGLNVAQSDLAVEFGASQTEILWFINIYTITLSTLLLPLGAIDGQWSRRPMLLLGLAVFGVASAAARMEQHRTLWRRQIETEGIANRHTRVTAEPSL